MIHKNIFKIQSIHDPFNKIHQSHPLIIFADGYSISHLIYITFFKILAWVRRYVVVSDISGLVVDLSAVERSID